MKQTPGLNLCLARAALAIGHSLVLAACGPQSPIPGNGLLPMALDGKPAVLVADVTYPTTDIKQDDISYYPSFGTIEQKLTLDEQAPVTSTYQQTERVYTVETFEQGYDGGTVEEEFKVSDIGKLDLLVVIDNSGSMSAEQANLADKLPALTTALDKTDWQIAVVTTDNSCLRGGKTIKKGDANAAADFKAAIMAGIEGANLERGIFQAWRAFQGKCDQGDYKWLRDNSTLAVFFVSDENSHCLNGSAQCQDGEKPEDLIKLMRSLRDRTHLNAYALTWSRDDRNQENKSLCRNGNPESAGTAYIEVVEKLAGLRRSICAADYTEALNEISVNVARQVRYEYKLKYMPDEPDPVVEIDGTPYTDYALVADILHLLKVTDMQSLMKIRYHHGAKPRTDRFTLQNKPGPETLEVSVNGVPLTDDEFALDPDGMTFLIGPFPEDKANIQATYRQDEPMIEEIDLSQLPILGAPLQVEVNGEAFADYSFDESTKKLVFNKTPADGAKIDVQWRDEHGRITQYKLGGYLRENLLKVQVIDPEDLREIPATFTDGNLMLPPEEVSAGRELRVLFVYPSAKDVLASELPNEPLPGSVSVESLDAANNCIENISVTSKLVNYNCAGDDLPGVNITYSYIAQRYSEFAPPNLPLGEDLVWRVYVDGIEISSFTVEGNRVRVPVELLPVGSNVRLLVSIPEKKG